MSEWQPIETAPKDGSDILAFFHDGEYVRIVSWDSGKWVVDDGWGDTHSSPTHWIRIPDPPSID